MKIPRAENLGSSAGRQTGNYTVRRDKEEVKDTAIYTRITEGTGNIWETRKR